AHAILAGILVNLVGILTVHRNSQAGAGSLEVIVGLGPGSGPEGFFRVPLGNHVLVGHRSAAEIVAGGFLAGASFVGGGVVCEYEDMLTLLMFEIVVNAFFFHQSRDKV